MLGRNCVHAAKHPLVVYASIRGSPDLLNVAVAKYAVLVCLWGVGLEDALVASHARLH
jgi:hypothetical protein